MSAAVVITNIADVVVLGMGPGGEDVAGNLASAGLSVIGIETGLVGGECPYWGCIPSKMMIRAADLLAESRRIPGVAGTAPVSPDWAPVAARIRAEATDHWDDTAAVDRFVGKGGKFVRGRGRRGARWGRCRRRALSGHASVGHRHRDDGRRAADPRACRLAVLDEPGSDRG